MIAFRSLVAIAPSLLAVTLTARSASAIPTPDHTVCTHYPCLYIDSGGGEAIVGSSVGGPGLTGDSDYGNGIIGYTLSSSAAAISAVSPSNSGIAYWGTGGIILTGSSAQKAGGGSWSAYSDARIKKDVKTLHWGLEELREIRPVTFKYNGLGGTDDDGHEYVGVIAQELEKVLPSMVSSRKGKLRKSDAQETDIKIVDPSAFTYVLVNAVQEQQQIIEQQGARIAKLERGRDSLSASILGGGVGTGLAIGLLPLAFVALRRRKSLPA